MNFQDVYLLAYISWGKKQQQEQPPQNNNKNKNKQTNKHKQIKKGIMTHS